MDGIAGPAGSGVPVKFKGETLILQPLTLKDFGVIERHLLARRKNPLDVVKDVLPDLPQHLAEKVLERAYEDARKEAVIPASEVVEFIDSVEGLAFTYWVGFEKGYPGRFTLDEVAEFMDGQNDVDLETLKQLRDAASGIDVQGNSSGQGQTSESRRDKRRKRRRSRRGPKPSEN